MKRITLSLFILLTLHLSAIAQRPDLPGSLLLDLGVNSWAKSPTDISLNGFQSKTVGLTYFYDFPIGDSKFTFTPGLGLTFEKFSVENDFTIVGSIDANGVRTVNAVPLTDLTANVLEFGKSKIGINYFEIPLEIRYYTRKDDYRKGIRAAFGVKAGVMYSSFIKYRYEDSVGDRNMVKDRGDLGVSRFRYGIQARFGAGPFSLFGYYELSDKFSTPPAGGEDTRNLTFGISLIGF